MELKEKNVVVIGGFGGIGLATCKCFLENNVKKLAILDLKEDEPTLKHLQQSYPNTEIIYTSLDVTKKPEIEATFKNIINKFGYIDILLNSSGVVADDDPELTINVNLLGLINVTLTVFPYMSRINGGKGGLIVNVSSVYGLEPCPPMAVYTASKHGVIGFTRSMASTHYYEKTGISLIVICPGYTVTDIMKNLQVKTTLPFMNDLILKFNGGIQTPDECASNIVKAVIVNKNGSIWICDQGKLQEVNLTEYWSCDLKS